MFQAKKKKNLLSLFLSEWVNGLHSTRLEKEEIIHLFPCLIHGQQQVVQCLLASMN